MSSSLHPASGARFLLERLTEAGTGATYRAAIYTRDTAYESTAALADDGTVELPPSGAPPELHDQLLAHLRLLARDAAKRRDAGLPPWPPRVLRWRA